MGSRWNAKQSSGFGNVAPGLHKGTAYVTIEIFWYVDCEVLTLNLGKILSLPGLQLLLL